MNNRVLVVNNSPHDSLNSSTLRTIGLIKGLLQKGYTVDWLCCHISNYVNNDEFKNYGIMNNVNIIYWNEKFNSSNVKKKTGNIKKLVRNIYTKFFILGVQKKKAKLVDISVLSTNEYKYLISISDPKVSHITAKKLIDQGLKYEKWIQYWGDPIIGDISCGSLVPKFFQSAVEKRLFSFCDRIAYTSPITMQEEMRQHNRYSSKMITVPTPYIFERLSSSEPCHNGFIRIGYFGAYHSKMRNIMPLYNSVKNNSSFELVLYGNSDLILELNDRININERQNVGDEDLNVDIIVCILNRTGTQIPGKIYYESATDKPVLVIIDGEYGQIIKEYFEEFNRFEFCDNNEESITSAVNKIISSGKKYSPCKLSRPDRVVEELLK